MAEKIDFEEALSEYIKLVIDEKKAEYSPGGLEPFSVQADKMRKQLADSMHTFHKSFTTGYQFLLQELVKMDPEIDIEHFQAHDSGKGVLDDPEAFIAYLTDGGLLFELLGFSPEILLKFYSAGCELMKKGQFSEAESAFFFLVTISPQVSNFWLALGYCYARLSEWEKAIGACLYSIELNRQNSQGYLTLIRIYNQMQEQEKALEVCQEALMVAKSHPGVTWADELCGIMEKVTKQITQHKR
jgi:tetratricopeptide (TPR) repeat protein